MQSMINIDLNSCLSQKKMMRCLNKLPHHLFSKEHLQPLRTKSCSFKQYPNYKYFSRNANISCTAPQNSQTYKPADATADVHVEGVRRGRWLYESSPWVDYFLACGPLPLQKSEKWFEERTLQLKEEVRKMLTFTTDNVEMMHLIDTIQRIGIGYHFEVEIEHALRRLHEAEFESDNLHHVALRFRLLRQNGFFVSADEFFKFKDGGCFDEKLSADVKGLYSLYNAGFLAYPGEEILDEAVSFAKSILKSKVHDLKSPVKKQVLRALKTPLHRMARRVETHFFIKEYEEEEMRNNIILELAKIDFNYLQKIHFEEMKELALWWKGLNIEESLIYARERLAECYMWVLSLYFEPKYSRARIMLTKLCALLTVNDDGLDIYSTPAECKLLNDAIQSWTVEAAELLPTHLKGLYLNLVNVIKSFEDELKPDEKYRIPYLIESIKILSNGHIQETEWLANRQIPTFNERLKPSLNDNVYAFVVCGPFIGVGEELSEEAFHYLTGIPDIVLDCTRISRYIDDVAGYERESKGGQCPSGLACYMIEHNLTKEEAVDELHALIEDSWKRVNQASLRPTPYPTAILEHLLNNSRGMETIYFYYEDGFNKCSHIKDLIASLLLKPFSQGAWVLYLCLFLSCRLYGCYLVSIINQTFVVQTLLLEKNQEHYITELLHCSKQNRNSKHSLASYQFPILYCTAI